MFLVSIIIFGSFWILACALIPAIVYFFVTKGKRKTLEWDAENEVTELEKNQDYHTIARQRSRESNDDFKKRRYSVTKAGQKLSKMESVDHWLMVIGALVGVILLFSVQFIDSRVETRGVLEKGKIAEFSTKLDEIEVGKKNSFDLTYRVEKKTIRRLLGIHFTDEEWHDDGERTDEFIVVDGN